jgi:hypothetical protein
VNMKTCFLSMGALQCGALSLCACSTDTLTWQQRRLHQPNKAELEWERTGHVMIYEGMTDREVERALDNHFNRVESMMFINTVVTDADGKPARHPESGELITEDDGCD